MSNSVQEILAKNLIALAKSMVPSGSVMEFKAKLTAMLEAKAAQTSNEIDDKAVAIMKTPEVDVLLQAILCLMAQSAKEAAASSENEIDDALAELFAKAIGAENCGASLAKA